MKFSKLQVYALALTWMSLGNIPSCNGLETGFFNQLYEKVACAFKEQCEYCSDTFIQFNVQELAAAMNTHLYGQHLVKDIVLPSLHDHLRNPNPPKALTLSFHGSTGTGKNFVGKLIANAIYKRGTNSRFVHHFIVPHLFWDQEQIPRYKRQLHEWIEGNITQCAHSLFIFDELEAMPEGLIDTINAYIDYHDNVDKISYNKAIFLFISMTAAPSINEVVIDSWEKGKRREDLTTTDLEKALMDAAYNEDGGLKGAQVIERSLIDHFVPFLPLERKHVVQCVTKEFEERGIRSELITKFLTDAVLDELSLYPEDSKAFSKQGCKRVYQKVPLVMNKLKLKPQPGTTRSDL